MHMDQKALSAGAQARTYTHSHNRALDNKYSHTNALACAHTHTHIDLRSRALVRAQAQAFMRIQAHTRTCNLDHNSFCPVCVSACASLLPPISPFSLYTFAPFLGADVSTCPTPSPYIPSLAPSNAFLTFHPRSLLCHFAFCVRCFHEEKKE